MAQLTLFNIILLLCGLSLHILISLRGVLLDKTRPFSMGFWIKDNSIDVVIGLICSFVSLLMAKDMIDFMGLTAANGSSFYSFHAFGSGYLGREWIFSVIKMLKSKTQE